MSAKKKDQAQDLRALVNEIESSSEQEIGETKQHDEQIGHDEVAATTAIDINGYTEADQGKIDILNLPPRKEIHAADPKWAHIKLSTSFIRLFIFIMIILLVLIVVLPLWDEQLLDLPLHFWRTW